MICKICGTEETDNPDGVCDDCKKRINALAKKIKNEKEKIFNNIRKEEVTAYIFLKTEFKKDNIISNYLFRFVFQSFYRLDGSGLSQEHKDRFFELLHEKQDNLSEILLELYKIKRRTKKGKHSVQFSFATKLLHTLDNDKPILDSNVNRVLKIGETKGEKRTERINSRVKQYTILQNIIQELLITPEIKKLKDDFRKKFNVDNTDISDVKVLDFILWSYGDLIK